MKKYMQHHTLHTQHLYWRAGFGLSPQQLKEKAGQSRRDLVEALLTPNRHLKNITVQSGKTPDIFAWRKMNKEQKRNLRKMSREKLKDLNLAWLEELSTSDFILQEKMTLFWHNHFACKTRNIYHAQQQLGTLRRLALGKFETLLLAIAKDPAMLQFLNNQQNVKRKPNENFARELLELFTIGRGNYTERDIKEAARAFTGWAANGDEFFFRTRQHDYGEKEFMGKKGDFSGEEIIKIILKQKQTAYFLTDKIYRYFVNPEPPQARLQQLAESFYASDYDITKLMRQIFMADWFYDIENIGVKIKSPIELLLGLQQQLGLKFRQNETKLFLQKFLGQILLSPPNVAGWPGNRSWIDSSTLLLRIRLVQAAYFSQSIELENKANFDAQMKGISRRDLKRFEADFNWQALNQMIASRNTDESQNWEILANFLLARPNVKALPAVRMAHQQLPEQSLASMSVLLVSLPEYQLC